MISFSIFPHGTNVYWLLIIGVQCRIISQSLSKARVSHGVIIIFKNLELKHAIEELILIWFASDADEYINSILKIPV